MKTSKLKTLLKKSKKKKKIQIAHKEIPKFQLFLLWHFTDVKFMNIFQQESAATLKAHYYLQYHLNIIYRKNKVINL